MTHTLEDLNNLANALYITICSRGAGTETITTEYLLGSEHEYTLDSLYLADPEQMTKDPYAELPQEISYERAQEILDQGKMVVGSLEEGPVYLIPKGMTEVEMWKQINQLELAMSGDELSASFNILQSAMLRAIISGAWTSYNAWRKLELEILSRKDFEKYMELSGRQLNDLLTEPNCRVLRESAKHYYNNTSPERTLGC